MKINLQSIAALFKRACTAGRCIKVNIVIIILLRLGGCSRVPIPLVGG